jgi:hypothetical protein
MSSPASFSIGNLHPDATEQVIRQLFDGMGTVSSVVIMPIPAHVPRTKARALCYVNLDECPDTAKVMALSGTAPPFNQGVSAAHPTICIIRFPRSFLFEGHMQNLPPPAGREREGGREGGREGSSAAKRS